MIRSAGIVVRRAGSAGPAGPAMKMRVGAVASARSGKLPAGGRFGRGGHRASRSRREAGFVVGRLEPQGRAAAEGPRRSEPP